MAERHVGKTVAPAQRSKKLMESLPMKVARECRARKPIDKAAALTCEIAIRRPWRTADVA